MFTQNKLKMDSLAEAVKEVIEKTKIDETGLRKAAYAAHKAGQSHFEFQGKKYPVKVQGEEVMAGKSIEEASVKVSTATGMKVYGGAKGGSGKAYLQQKYGDDLADVHGPSDKDLEAIKHEKKKKKEVDEDFNIEDFSLEEIQEFMQTEDYESLDELSKDTLKRYIPTAAADLSKKGINAGIDAKSGKTGVTKSYGDHFQKRYRGILKATNKLAKEEVDLDEGKMGQLSADLKDLSHDDFHKEYGKPKSHYDPTNFKKPVQPGKEMDRAKSLAQRGMASMKKEDTSFASRLLQSIREGKGNQPQETFTDNNMGEEMSSAQMKKREKIVMSMKDKTPEFKAKYGKRWKEVMYATATKMAMREETEQLSEVQVTTQATDPNKVTTDMIRGRQAGGKSNTFKPYKLQLKTNGEMKAPETDQPEDTKEKQKISTNPGPVNVKLDTKLTGSIPQTHFSKEKNITKGITIEQVRGVLKDIRRKEKELRRKDIKDFKDKDIHSEEVEYYEINEEKPEHTHIAHFEDKDGNWMAKLLINADHDGHAIDQANAASGKGPFGGLKVRKVERVTKVMEEKEHDDEKDHEDEKEDKKLIKKMIKKDCMKEEELDEAMDTRSDIPAALRKKRGDKPLTPAELKAPKKDTISAPGRVGKIGEEDKKSWRKETDWAPAKGDVKDKSGAIHTPMSRASHLAKQAMKNVGKSLNKETMMGKAGATSESIEILDESDLLDRYLSSIGVNPKVLSRDKKIGYANSSAFLRWKQTHQ
jgi:hypothetical protein